MGEKLGYVKDRFGEGVSAMLWFLAKRELFGFGTSESTPSTTQPGRRQRPRLVGHTAVQGDDSPELPGHQRIAADTPPVTNPLQRYKDKITAAASDVEELQDLDHAAALELPEITGVDPIESLEAEQARQQLNENLLNLPKS